MMIITALLVFNFITVKTESTDRGQNLSSRGILGKTRRILSGREVTDTRPYMAYLRPATTTATDGKPLDPNWLCGAVIIHENYILTSAACIENVKQFYVVSGTHRWVPFNETNECIKNGAKKAVWKCVPKSYFYDGNDFDNIRWMANDIAIVKTEDEFNFKRRVRGCDFVPTKIAYNNQTKDLEKAKTIASTAGWGSVDTFSDMIARTVSNSPVLLETDVVLLSKKKCKKHWDPRYHYIIDDYMVCGKDSMDVELVSSACQEHEVNCKELVYSDDDEDDDTPPGEISRRTIVNPDELEVHNANHQNDSRRQSKVLSAGFCENDHGGPLVVGQGRSSVVVGIISACQTRKLSNKCYGPFLYTSVWNNRNLINCAINKDLGIISKAKECDLRLCFNSATCRKLLRSSKTQLVETDFHWPSPVGGKLMLRTEDKVTPIEKWIQPLTKAASPKTLLSSIKN